jgi:predicted GIY-YIG superfamily endonuclease
MNYVYVIENVHDRTRHYVGCTTDLKRRLFEHHAGQSPHTSRFRPWHLVSYHAFADIKKGRAFEKYLESASGRAFLQRHLY